MILVSLINRFVKEDNGSHTTEMALAIALFALVAGCGFFTLGCPGRLLRLARRQLRRQQPRRADLRGEPANQLRQLASEVA